MYLCFIFSNSLAYLHLSLWISLLFFNYLSYLAFLTYFIIFYSLSLVWLLKVTVNYLLKLFDNLNEVTKNIIKYFY